MKETSGWMGFSRVIAPKQPSRAQSMALEVGSHIAHYDVTALIGEGDGRRRC